MRRTGLNFNINSIENALKSTLAPVHPRPDYISESEDAPDGRAIPTFPSPQFNCSIDHHQRRFTQQPDFYYYFHPGSNCYELSN